MGGQNVSCNPLGENVLWSEPSSFGGLRRWDLVWSAPVSSKDNDRAWTTRVRGKRIIGGGGDPKPCLGTGFYGTFSPPLGSSPFALRLKSG